MAEFTSDDYESEQAHDAQAYRDAQAYHEAQAHEAAGHMSRAGMDYTPPPRTGAFFAAGRHTARVKFLRRAMVLGAVFSVSVIALVVTFDPFRHLPGSVSIGGVGVKGTKVTMDSPKISGLQQGGGLYDVAAKTGLQDILTPSVIELIGVDAHIGMADGTTTHVLSQHGVYNSSEDTMALDGDVHIQNSSGYTFGLKNAMVDFKQGILASEQRMRVDLKGGYVFADGVRISNNGHVIAFTGHVSSTFDAPEEDPGVVPDPASLPPVPVAATPAEPVR